MKTSELPETLRPYAFHGLDFSYKERDTEVVSDCPFCGRENKFSIQVKKGLWRCLVCAEGSSKGGGNAHTFIKNLWELSFKETTDYSELMKSRGITTPDTFIYWEVCRSIINGRWLVPGYNTEGKLTQLYQWINIKGKHKLLVTPTLGHQLHGVNLYDKAKEYVYLCEGPWDGMALWETLRACKYSDNGLVPTSNPKDSLLSNVNVLCAPGTNTFFDKWAKLFKGKSVVIMYDNDHPRKHPRTNKPIPPAGYTGVQRVTGVLSGSDTPPTEIEFIKWGDNGYSE